MCIKYYSIERIRNILCSTMCNNCVRNPKKTGCTVLVKAVLMTLIIDDRVLHKMMVEAIACK